MWLFTKVGFFSVVQIKDMSGVVFVRARVRTDLQHLMNKYKNILVRGKANGYPSISHSPKADYPYRIVIRQTEFARLAGALARDIDYTNFKDAVLLAQGHERAELYHEVWAAMSDAEKRVNEVEEKPNPESPDWIVER